MTLISYKNDPVLKEKFVAEIEKHRKADQIIKGTYGDDSDGADFRGCAVGCSIDSLNNILGKKINTDNHTAYETELGIPEWLARLEDTLFEGMPAEDAQKWPTLFAESVPVGVNLDPIKWKFCAYLMKENIERVLTLDISDDLKKQVVDVIRSVLALNEESIETGVWNESAAESARSAAWSAAWSAAESARSAAWSARSAAWSAAESARSAAWSAASSAESAAESARSAAESARSAAWSAAESAAWSAAESARSAAWSARSAAWSAESARSAASSAAESAWSAAWSDARSAASSAAYLKHAHYLITLLKEAK